jgi:hypothetical protein
LAHEELELTKFLRSHLVRWLVEVGCEVKLFEPIQNRRRAAALVSNKLVMFAHATSKTSPTMHIKASSGSENCLRIPMRCMASSPN